MMARYVEITNSDGTKRQLSFEQWQAEERAKRQPMLDNVVARVQRARQLKREEKKIDASMLALWHAYPVLRDFCPLTEWHADDAIIALRSVSYASKFAGLAVLGAWNCTTRYDLYAAEEHDVELPVFLAHEAMARWDDGNRAAWAEFCRDPWCC